MLTLTGAASQTAYQAALESVTYSSSVADPTHGGADAARAVTFTVNDGVQSSNSPRRSLNVYAAAAAGISSQRRRDPTYQLGGAAVAVAQGLAVSDSSGSTLASATVAIAGGFLAGDALNFSNQSGITGSYNASTGVLTLTEVSVGGCLPGRAGINHLLIGRRPARSRPAPRGRLDFSVNDGSQSSAALAASVALTPKAVQWSRALPSPCRFPLMHLDRRAQPLTLRTCSARRICQAA